MSPRAPILLDAFCKAGGAGVGYRRAGWRVLGVDLEPQPRYPFPFIQGDAVAFIARHGHHFDAIHASPPCQAHVTMSNRWRGKGGRADSHVDIIPATRDAILAAGVPYVIENVVGARRALRSPVLLRGGMFGLGVDRPRLFESSVPLTVPPAVPVVNPIGVYGDKPDGRRLFTRADGSVQRAARSLEEAGRAMGIGWMTWDEITQAIPPAYTEHLGRQLLAALRQERAA